MQLMASLASSLPTAWRRKKLPGKFGISQSHLEILLLRVEELLNPAKGDRTLDEDADQQGDKVHRKPQQVEDGHRYEGCLGVKDVV